MGKLSHSVRSIFKRATHVPSGTTARATSHAEGPHEDYPGALHGPVSSKDVDNFVASIREKERGIVVILDPSCRIVRTNAVFEQLTGYKFSELRGKVYWEIFVAGSELGITKVVLGRILAGEERNTVENHLLLRNGSQRVIRWQIKSISGLDGPQCNVMMVGEDVTIQRELTKALKESEERFEFAVNKTTDGLWDWNIEKGELYVSPRFKSLVYSATDTYTSFVDCIKALLHEEDKEHVSKAITDHLYKRVSLDTECRLKSPGGDFRWYHLRGQSFWNAGGKPVRLAGSIQDISTRKAAEDALCLTQFSLDHSRDAVFWLAQDGQIIYTNDAACKAFGYSRTELLERHVFDIDKSLNMLSWDELWNKTKQQGAVTFKSTYQNRKGEDLPVEARYCHLNYENNSFIFLYIRDITEELKAEESIRETDARLKAILDHSPALICLKDMEGRYMFANQQFQWAFARDARQLIGMMDAELMPLSVSESILENDQKVIESRVPLELEERISISGKPRFYFTIRFLLYNNQNKPYAICMIASDITDRKKAVDALKESEGRYRLLFERNLAGVLRISSDGTIRDCNESAAKILGFRNSAQTSSASIWAMLVDDSERVELLAKIEKDRILQNYILHIHKRDNNEIWILANITTTERKDGTWDIQMTIVDITDRKKTESALRRSLRSLKTSRLKLQSLSRRLVEIQESERRSIARELHDEVGQNLTGLKLSLEMLGRMPYDSESIKLKECQTLVNGLMAQLRDMSLNLRPTMLDDLGLIPAILWHIDRYQQHTGVTVNLEHYGIDRRFQPDIETAAYRIIQEALTNVARHARVNEVTLRLLASPEALIIHIEDRGAGFDHSKLSHASFGISGMQERATLADGCLTIDSVSGHGTCITAEFPLVPLTAPDLSPLHTLSDVGDHLPHPSADAAMADSSLVDLPL
ncbi:MAG TPA: PAS domain S-box protein [Isosphaeraceae bacterium]|jgi:PAS domain S-box-containing protein|nr:PAS domain S-box protein [Isosphaeraceae bacterium]